MRSVSVAGAIAILASLAAGCFMGVEPVGETTVLSVVPAGGATNVDPSRPIVVEFSHAMAMGMEQYAALHEGDVTGPVVRGAWSWSSDRLRLTFTPATPLKPAAQYAIHLGGDMRDASGARLNYDHCAGQHGGRWLGASMMGSSMMGGRSSMMRGWRHASGTLGMAFLFTTA